MNRWRRIHSLIWAAALIAILHAGSVMAMEANAAFDAANKLYEQGQFAAAASAYEQVIQSGSVSQAVYFNLGNAQFKTGDVGRALAAYHQAEQLAPRDPDLRANLQFVRNQIQGPTQQPSRFQQWLNRLSVNEWTTLTGVAFWLCLALLTAMQLRPRWRPALRNLALLSGVGTVALGVCLVSVLSANSTPTAIVTAKNAAVRNGPLEESPTALTVHDGAELSVLDTKDGWLQISVGNRIGWLKREQALVLPNS